MRDIIFGIQSNGYPIHLSGEIKLEELYRLKRLISVMIETFDSTKCNDGMSGGGKK